MRNTKERIMAIDLRRSRFGYAILDGTNAVLEWGSGEIWADGKKRGDFKNARVQSALRVSSPATVVVRKSQYRGSLDSPLKDRLMRQIRRDAEGYSIPVVMIGQDEIRTAFQLSKRASKYEIASVVARKFPELRLMLPAERKAWEPEMHSMIIFDTIAAGLAYLQPDGVSEPPE
jgi:hypothetical protein